MARFLGKLGLFFLPFAAWQAFEIFVLPVDYFAFRPWDVMVVKHVDHALIGPFLPDQDLTRWEWGYNDFVLKRPGARPKLTQWVSDRHGHRNRPPDKEPARYDIVVHGDSNIVGSYLDQKDILSETLARKCGCAVYAVSGGKVWRNDDAFDRAPPRYLVSNVYPAWQPQTLLSWRFTLTGWSTRQPLPRPVWTYVAEERAWKQPAREFVRARLGLTQPASYAAQFSGARNTLHDVDTMTDEEAFAALHERAVAMSEAFRAKGTTVIYLMMPVPAAQYAKYAGFFEGLRRAGVSVVDFPPTAELPNGYPDDYWQAADSHWTEKAVRGTADRILAEIRRLERKAP